MPMRYTSQEYANMHLIYGECRCNASDFERHPNLERYPDHCVFIIVHRSLTEGGHFPNRIQAGGTPSFPYEEGVLQEVADDLSTSVRGIEERTGIPKSTAHRILQRAEMHPFPSIQRVQCLLPRDYPERILFCGTMLQRHNQNPQFIQKIL
ncbi:hypothetical protein EVAR_92817_1 [Eumeta japonica]|uniref:HTH iclR-type domain-containing protein n=1 Tax=Eumeta variegata TaxID=151549 RepID=A0A4C1TAX6_EUMVA|nr:hypothetical protein EVAR_92817_1 [Eumeta japonica]